MTRLFINEECAHPLQVPCTETEVWAYSRPSPDHPSRNEDAAGVWALSGRVVVAVADGMGGSPLGAESASIAIRALDERLAGAQAEGDLRPHVLDAFEQANRTILALGVGGGSTLVVAEMSGAAVRTYHVGDSAALLVGQRGRVKVETILHSPVGYGVAAGLIDPESALNHDDRHYLSNQLGANSMHIEVGSRRSLAARDTLLLASDGVLDNVGPNDLIEIIRCGPLSRAAAQLAQLCEERSTGADANQPGKADDVTFILLRGASNR